MIFPFIKIRINELETRSIGHFSITTEIFLSEIEKKKHFNKSGVFIWFINEKISNVFLLNKWREKLIIGPRYILYPLFKMINEFEFLKFMRTPFRHWKYQGQNKNYLWQIRDIHQVLQKTKPNIKFNKREEKDCVNFLKKKKIKKEKYLCFFARTHHFRNDIPSVRDADINNQVPGIISLCKRKNLKAIRLGDKKQPKVSNKSKYLIDYAKSNFKSSMLDIYLPMNCKFMIGSTSGISHIPILNRKKILIVDFSQFHDLDGSPDYYIPIILPKKYRKISNKKILNYSEVFSMDLSKIQYDKDLRKLGYETVPNSKKEILYAINEMNSLIDSKKKCIEDTQLQKRFWNIFNKYYKLKIPHNLKISKNFLNINKKYIN